MVLFILLNTSARCFSSDKLLPSIIPRCFCEIGWQTILLLKAKGGWESLLTFLLTLTSWACLPRSELKPTFSGCVQWHILAWYDKTRVTKSQVTSK